MAEVFRARASSSPRNNAGARLDRLVALKCIHPALAEDPDFISMFRDETRIAAQLSHPNIARVLDFGEASGQPFLAFEHIHGRDLRALIRHHQVSGRVVPVSKACYIILEACRGLDYAHDLHDASGRSLRVVHRDISPQNLLLSFHGEVKLIDFGIAKAACRTATTERGWIKGKMRYMSPEQMRGAPADRRSDIFSLGVVLFELLTSLHKVDTDNTLEKVR